MSNVRIFAWCTLSVVVGFVAGQLSPSLDSPRSAGLRPVVTLPLKAPHEASLREELAAPSPTVAPPADQREKSPIIVAARELPPVPVARAVPAAPAVPPPPPAPEARPSRASLLSSFRFAGIGAHGGVRLGRVTAGSLPDLLGLKTGDEIITLNGLRIAHPQEALQAYARLPYVDDWVARIQRNGVQTEVRYALR